MVTADGKVSAPIAGVPSVHAVNQGGLLDVAVAPDFAQDRRLYLAFAQVVKAVPHGSGQCAARRYGTDGGETDFAQADIVAGGHHFGSRIAIARDGSLCHPPVNATSQRSRPGPRLTLGKVIPHQPDGSVPGQSVVGKTGASRKSGAMATAICRGAAIHPVTGKLWTHEHGPKGDEINIPAAGKNYGWPVVGYGIDYSGQSCMTAPARQAWSRPFTTGCRRLRRRAWPSTRPTGFQRGKVRCLSAPLPASIWPRLTLDGERVVAEERLLGERNERIRDVRQGPDGYLYVLTDERNGKILRVSPQPGFDAVALQRVALRQRREPA